MKIYAGTSGFSYKEWKGPFYPEKLPNAKMLSYYAEQLPSVEINNTFYRLPKKEVLEKWSDQVPDTFRFSIKASRRITHFKRLNDAADETEYLLSTLEALKKKLGVVLFQLPPFLRKDAERLTGFLKLLPKNTPAAFEFRHDSWFDDEIADALRSHNCALCIADTDEKPNPEFITTTDWGYLRLRRAKYTAPALKKWAKQISDAGWKRTFVFFKHEDEGAGPKMAEQFLKITQ